MTLPIALTIAGSDPSGGAGIQADLKTFHQLRVYGMSVLTLITVQNTQGVARVESLPADLVRQQLDCVLNDIMPDAVKTGAFDDAEGISQVAQALKGYRGALVLDPVMTSSHGEDFLNDRSKQIFIDDLLPLAALVTPNTVEAEWLAGMKCREKSDFEAAARAIQKKGVKNVLLKGGHILDEASDLLLCSEEVIWLESPRIEQKNTHGTGCTLSAAITAFLARGTDLPTAVKRAKSFVTQAISEAPALGAGIGPLNHFVDESL